ncbi:MAG: hypothetical protein GWO20_00390 [Candidatus Korarchaeota archaeon]|nr:hypothetical protein [Candidatus Korarchaeota archaeon]NIU82035.1 hypothetical protein [Candidatus Thorarchaeota archaeon]NIW12454.1 hypothetical protein [Candidatus Thorarchaeota archaeon]NIW50669.1 hypothetical protein [Candidatus Korarchaeota archaeon]
MKKEGQIKNKFLREEIKAERRHLEYLLDERGKHPLEVAEKIIADVLSLLKEQIKERYPSLSEMELKAKMRDKLASGWKREDKS